MDPFDQIVFAFQRRPFAADQSEHHHFPLWHKSQRLEGTGALIVVFEQKAIDGEFVEKTFGDGIVTPFRVPVTAVVAATEMDCESDAGVAGGREAGIVGVERGGQHLRGIDAQFLLHPRSPLWIEIVAVARRIDLQIGDAAGGERADVFGHDGGDGAEQFVGIVVDRVGDAVFERDGGKLRGAGQGDFDGSGSVFSEEGKLPSGKGLPLLQRRGDDAIDAADRCGRVRFLVIVLPLTLHGVAEIEAFHGVGEIAHEVGATQFTIAKDVEPNLLLTLKNPQNVAVLDSLEFRGNDVRGAGAEQFRRAEKAADMVGAKGRRHMQVLIVHR
jgi:hypothetical protein